VVASPKSGPWWVLWVRVCPWLILAPKCSDYALTNLLFSLWRSVLVSVYLSFFLVSSRSCSMPFYPQSATSQGACPTLYISTIFTLDSHLSLSKSLGACHERWKQNKCNWRDLMKQSICNGNHQVRGQKCFMMIHTSHHDIRIILWYPSTLSCQWNYKVYHAYTP
jgi:hypothetical protein